MTPTNENHPTTPEPWAEVRNGLVYATPASERAFKALQAQADLTNLDPPVDTADYGGLGNLDTARGPDETYCRNCQELALNHTPGRWSIYGVCPTNETETN